MPRELPFGDIAAAQWLTTRPVEATDFFFVFDPENALTDLSRSNTVGKLFGRPRSKLCKTKFGDDEEGVATPRKITVTHYTANTSSCAYVLQLA